MSENPLILSSFLVGIEIRLYIDRQCRRIWVGRGGHAATVWMLFDFNLAMSLAPMPNSVSKGQHQIVSQDTNRELGSHQYLRCQTGRFSFTSYWKHGQGTYVVLIVTIDRGGHSCRARPHFERYWSLEQGLDGRRKNQNRSRLLHWISRSFEIEIIAVRRIGYWNVYVEQVDWWYLRCGTKMQRL